MLCNYAGSLRRMEHAPDAYAARIGVPARADMSTFFLREAGLDLVSPAEV